jgi:hypothetical protein
MHQHIIHDVAKLSRGKTLRRPSAAPNGRAWPLTSCVINTGLRCRREERRKPATSLSPRSFAGAMRRTIALDRGRGARAVAA